MKKVFAIAVLCIIVLNCVMLCGCVDKDVSVEINANNIGVNINQDMYGIFLEDISYAGDGGLISNLVCNDSFEYAADRTTNWKFEGVNTNVNSVGGLNSSNKHYLEVESNGSGTLTNLGYVEYYDYQTYDYNSKKMNTPDMGFKKDTDYRLVCYLKNVDYIGTLQVELNSKNNKDLIDIDIEGVGNEWTKVTKTLNSKASEDGALTFVLEGEGTFCIDFVTLEATDSYGYGEDTWKYVSLRTDFVQALEDLNPSFVRFPGGCLAEGTSVTNLYDWKETIGALESRVQYDNIWSDDENGKSYGNTNALGYHEYFQLSEDLGAEPLPILNVGMICQFEAQYREHVKLYEKGKMDEGQWQVYLDAIALRPGTSAFDEYVQDILDLIEYANGDVSTTWGALRAANGHPEPFELKYIGLGNENWGEVYWRNFEALYDAVKTAYPEITIISSAGYWWKDSQKDDAWEFINKNYSDTIVDEHYYTGGNKLFNNNDYYDNYDRNGAQVFLGEYAVTCKGFGTLETKNNLWSAVEEASYMTGLERNGDIVKWASYAPTFAKVNSNCWDQNLIWFDSQNIVLTPNYYNQMLFSNNVGSKVVNTDFSNSGCYSTTTVDTEEQVIYFKIVNKNKSSIKINLDVKGFGSVNSSSMQYLADSSQAACNELGSTTIVPKQVNCSINKNNISTEVEGYSINIVRVYYRDNNGDSAYQLPEMLSTMEQNITKYTKFYINWETQLALIIASSIIGGTGILVGVFFLWKHLKKKKLAKHQ